MSKIDFAQIRTKVQSGDYEISSHDFEQMRQRGITLDDLENVIIHGTIIEADDEAKPFPKCIFWGFTVDKGESIHVVCSVTPRSKAVTVISQMKINGREIAFGAAQVSLCNAKAKRIVARFVAVS